MDIAKKSLIYIILFIPPLIFFTDLTRNPYYFQIAFFYILVCLTWILVILEWIKNRKITLRIGACDLQLHLFFLVAFISIVYTYFANHNYLVPEIIEEGKSIINADYLKSSIYSESLKKIMFTVVNVILSYYLALNLNRGIEIHKTFHILFMVGLIASIYGIMQYFGIEVIWPRELNPFGNRCVTTFGNPNFFSSYAMMLFPVVFGYFILNNTNNFWRQILIPLILLAVLLVATMYVIKERNPNLFLFLILFSGVVLILSSISGRHSKNIYLIFIFVYYIALLCTLTRSSWFGLFVGMLIFLILLFKYRKDLFLMNTKKFVLLSAIALFTFLLFPKSMREMDKRAAIERITEIWKQKGMPYAPVHQRFLIWLCAIDMVREKPLLGKGWGCFELFYPFYQGKYLFDPWLRGGRTHANNSHNEILEIWSQTGFLGLGLYIWFLATLFFFCLKTIRKLQPDEKVLYIGVFSSIPAMLVDNILNVSLHFCIPAFLFWWNMGILMNLSESKEKNLEFKKMFPILILSIIGLVLIAINYTYRLFGEINYFSGFKYSKQNKLDLALKPLENAERLHLEVNNNYELGNVYARKNMTDKAIWAYYRALAANCGYDEIHFNLATVFLQKGDIKNAILNYTQALYINPLSREAYYALGNTFLANRNPQTMDASMKLFEQAVKIYPNEKDFWNTLGYIYTMRNEPEKAIVSYKKALEIDPEFHLARHNLLQLLRNLEKQE